MSDFLKEKTWQILEKVPRRLLLPFIVVAVLWFLGLSIRTYYASSNVTITVKEAINQQKPIADLMLEIKRLGGEARVYHSDGDGHIFLKEKGLGRLGEYEARLFSKSERVYKLPHGKARFKITDCPTEKVSLYFGRMGFSNSDDEHTKGMEISGPQTFSKKQGGIMMARIDLTDGHDKNRPIEHLTEGNFEIYETFRDEKNREKTLPVPSEHILELMFEQSPVRVMLVLDRSGSMTKAYHDPSKGISRPNYEIVRDAALNFISQVFASNKDVLVSVLPFYLPRDQEVERPGFFEAAMLKKPDGGIWFGPRDGLQKTITQRFSAQNHDQTPLFDAVKYALMTLRALPGENYRIVVLLTDGAENDSLLYPGEVKRMAKQFGLPIVTIGYGQESAPFNDDLLELAEISGAGPRGVGAFLDQDSGSLPYVFDELGLLPKIYKIRWRSPQPIRKGNQVRVRLVVTYQAAGNRFFRKSVTGTYIAGEDDAPEPD